MKTEVDIHQVLKAHSISDFVIALGKNLAWPWIVLPYLAPLNWIPFLMLAWFYYRAPDEGEIATELTLGIGFWVILQALATAIARGAGGNHPGWRYMDSTSFTMIVNVLSVILLLDRYTKSSPHRRWWMTSGAAWGFSCAVGLVLICSRAWEIDIPERFFYQKSQLRNARLFLATDDLAWLKTRPILEIPYPQAERLAALIRDPRIQNILPTSVRKPLRVVAETNENHGFVTNGVLFPKPVPAYEFSWGSFTTNGTQTQGTFVSAPIRRSNLPYLEILVAGQIGTPGLTLELLDLTTQQNTPLLPASIPGEKWLPCYVKAPAGEFKIIADDHSTSGWLAFQEPREMGALSFAAAKLLPWDTTFFALGCGSFLILTVCQMRSNPKPKLPDRLP